MVIPNARYVSQTIFKSCLSITNMKITTMNNYSNDDFDRAQRAGEAITQVVLELQEEGIDPALLVLTLISSGVYHAYQIAAGDFAMARKLFEGGQLSGAEMYADNELDDEFDDGPTTH